VPSAEEQEAQGLVKLRLSGFKVLVTWQGTICILSLFTYATLALSGWGQEAAALLPIAGGCVQALGGALRPREVKDSDQHAE
jgi:hypothetical protein